MKPTILVTGANGTVGSKVVEQLHQRGAKVRALVRKPNPENAFASEVEVAVGDLLDPASVNQALQGVDKLYLLNALTPDEVTQGLIAYDLAKRNKVKHIVYHSVFAAERFPDVPHFASKLTIETALRHFETPFTIIRPNYFFQNDLSVKDPITQSHTYPVPLGAEGVSAVDARDIAEAAAIALTTEGHFGKTYNLVGPEPLSGPKAAAIWSALLGERIQYSGHDMDAWENQMRQFMPPWLALELRMMFQAYLERGFTASSSDIQTLTGLLGHAPRSYEAFARETVSTWQEHAVAATR